MSAFNRILCPIDMSENSLASTDLATIIAKNRGAKIIFMYVAQRSAESSVLGHDYAQSLADEDRRAFNSLRPTDPDIPHEHVFRQGNAGSELVKESKSCDMVVMSTHGRNGIMRLLSGSTTQYVSRHAKCPVITVRSPSFATLGEAPQRPEKQFVTEVMHQVAPVSSDAPMARVVMDLERARQTIAPVVEGDRRVVGVLTRTDVADYRSSQSGIDAHVVDKVIKFMSSPVVTIGNSETTDRALEIFAQQKSIHHLVVVDEHLHPLGILEPSDCLTPKEQEPTPTA